MTRSEAMQTASPISHTISQRTNTKHPPRGTRSQKYVMATTKGTRKRSTPKTPTSRQPKHRVSPPPPPLTISDEELYARVARQAYRLYQERGEEHGHDLADWFTAEQLVKAELLHGPVPEEPLEAER